MKAIASYYIKSLFLKKVHDMNDKTYWQNKVSLLFRTMVEELYQAIQKKEIPFFWNCKHNLIGGLKPTLQKVYVDKLKEVVCCIYANDVEKVVSFLLTTEELREFKKSDFYQKQTEIAPIITPQGSLESSQSESSLFDQLKMLSSEMETVRPKHQKDKKYDELELKINRLAEKVALIEDRLERLEMKERHGSVADIVLGTNSIRLDDMPANLSQGTNSVPVDLLL